MALPSASLTKDTPSASKTLHIASRLFLIGVRRPFSESLTVIPDMAQHFLISSASRDLKLRDIYQMSEQEAFERFRELRWAGNIQAPQSSNRFARCWCYRGGGVRCLELGKREARCDVLRAVPV
jgi:hypothetical protein